jgi:hypothetical protein
MAKQPTSIGPHLSALPAAALHRELAKRARKAQRIARKRDRLLAAAARLDQQIAALGGSTNGSARGRTGRTRPKNEMSLAESLAKVLDGKTMRVTDACEAVLKSGYKTNSKTFRTMVNIALIKSGKFKRVARGEYTAK